MKQIVRLSSSVAYHTPERLRFRAHKHCLKASGETRKARRDAAFARVRELVEAEKIAQRIE